MSRRWPLSALLTVIPVMMIILSASCKKHEKPAPNGTLATYRGTRIRVGTASGFAYDTALHTSVHYYTVDTTYQQDTAVVTQTGPDSIRLSGSLIAIPDSGIKINDWNSYTFQTGMHSGYEFRFYNNYDSVSYRFWSWGGVSPSQFTQTDVYFNCRKQ